MKILFQVSYAPNVIRVRSYNFIKALAKRGNTITVATLWENEAERRDLDELARIKGVRILAYPIHRSQIFLNLIRAFFTGDPLQTWYSWQPLLAQALVRELEHEHYDVIHCEHLRGSPYGLLLKIETHKRGLRIPVIYDSVDSISLLYELSTQLSLSTKWRWITHFELPRTKKYEGFLMHQFDRVLVTTRVDQQSLIELAKNDKNSDNLENKIFVVTNGVDLKYFKPDNSKRQSGMIVFSGKMSYHANYSMAMFLIQKVMPLVWEIEPLTHLYIVGKFPSATLINLALDEPRIKVTGWVSDIRPYLQKATVVVAPLLYGAGIQNKILEAMACGTPVVASSLANIPLQACVNEEILVADVPQPTADALLRVLSDRIIQNLIGAGGENSWKAITIGISLLSNWKLYTGVPSILFDL